MKTSYHDILFYGKKVTDLTIEELYKGIEFLYNENERYRDMYHNSELNSVELMEDMIHLAKPNYITKDGTIKRGVEIEGIYYAPRNDC